MSSRGSREGFYSLKIIVSLQPRKIASKALITEKSTQTIHFNVLIHTIKRCFFFFFSLKSLLPIFKKEIRAFYSNKHLTKIFFHPLWAVISSRSLPLCGKQQRGAVIKMPKLFWYCSFAVYLPMKSAGSRSRKSPPEDLISLIPLKLEKRMSDPNAKLALQYQVVA